MRTLTNKLPLRWIFRIIIIVLASYITGLSIWWCALAYLGIMFLIQFTKNLIIVILGIILVVIVSLALFLGLLAH